MGRGSPSERRIVMARNLALRWLSEKAHPEHQVRIFYVGRENSRGIPGVLRAFRDSKLRIGSLEAIPDLGVSEAFDSVTVWSSDRQALKRLAAWFEGHGYETSGVW